MSDQGERDLIALIAREQRGFRFILFAGLATLVVLIAMSAGLGFYYYRVSQQMTNLVEREAFDTRRRIAQQDNRVAAQDLRLRRVQEEIRSVIDQRPVGAGQDLSTAVAAAGGYLQDGRLSVADEHLIEVAASSSNGGPAKQALLRGVTALIVWGRNSEQVPNNATALPQRLEQARADFTTAAGDHALAPLANAGAAWVLYIEASSDISNYRADTCAAMFAKVAASAVNGTPGPQPLWWQAQCERKLGRTAEALRDYARTLERTAGVAASLTQDLTEVTLAMNAFHGVGTSLIALHGVSDDDANMRAALSVARNSCPAATGGTGSPRMQIAESCLRIAMSLRERLGQTPNQVSGTSENLSFVYLRDRNFQAAYDNARRVERTGVFPWNELMRALTARHVPNARDAAAAQHEARRNISFFRVRQFNLCELRVLLDDALYNEAVEIIRQEHPNEAVSCEAASS